MLQNWVQFNESYKLPIDRVKDITLDDITNIVKSAREMQQYLNDETSNYPFANKLYKSLQFITGLGSPHLPMDFLAMSDDEIVEGISKHIKSTLYYGANEMDFLDYWDVVIYMCKFPKHPDVDEIKVIINEEITESSEYNTFIDRLHLNYDIQLMSDDWGFRIPKPGYLLYIAVQHPENIREVEKEIVEARKHTISHGYGVDDIISYKPNVDGYGGVCIRVYKI